MVKAWQTVVLLLGVLVVFSAPAAAQTSPFFYAKTCPKLFPIMAKQVYVAILNESRIAASLLRLHFHDCFVQGCDGSILLASTPTNETEQDARPNLNSVRGFSTIDTIKAAVEKSCPNVVSCADIVTLSAFFSVVLSGGPIWWVPLGRRDSFFSNINLTTNLPGPASTVADLKSNFSVQNLTTQDVVALSGAHTIGLSRCTSFTARLYNFLGSGTSDPALNSTLLARLEAVCPNGGNGNVTTPLDIQTPTGFDNLYFKNLLQHNGILNSDQQLTVGANDTNALVQLYAANQTKFFQDFATSMIRMGNLNLLTGSQGEIRKNCSVRNPTKSVIESVIAQEDSTDAAVEKVVEGLEEVAEGAEKLVEGAMEYFKEIVMEAIREIAYEEMQRLVEDDISGTHSAM